MLTVKTRRVTRGKHGLSAFKGVEKRAPGFTSSSTSYQSIKSFSDPFIEECIERAFSDGYEYAQREYADRASAASEGKEIIDTLVPPKESSGSGSGSWLSPKAKKNLKTAGWVLLGAGALTGAGLLIRNGVKKNREAEKTRKEMEAQKSRFK